jgi:hypothetical protein
MEYIYKLFISDLAKQRMEQLQKQEKHDEILQSLPCHDVVKDYLLTQRQINRDMMKEYGDSGLWSARSLLQKHLDIVTEHQKDMDVRLCSYERDLSKDLSKERCISKDLSLERCSSINNYNQQRR